MCQLNVPRYQIGINNRILQASHLVQKSVYSPGPVTDPVASPKASLPARSYATSENISSLARAVLLTAKSSGQKCFLGPPNALADAGPAEVGANNIPRTATDVMYGCICTVCVYPAFPKDGWDCSRSAMLRYSIAVAHSSIEFICFV